jgi:hypothetical protein
MTTNETDLIDHLITLRNSQAVFGTEPLKYITLYEDCFGNVHIKRGCNYVALNKITIAEIIAEYKILNTILEDMKP